MSLCPYVPLSLCYTKKPAVLRSRAGQQNKFCNKKKTPYSLYSLLPLLLTPFTPYLSPTPLRREEVAHFEAGAVTARQVAVTVDQCPRETEPEETDELQHGVALLVRPRVAGVAFLVEAADVADSYRACIIALTVRALQVNRLAYLDMAVEVNHIMIAAAGAARGGETALFVPLGNIIFFPVLSRFCSRTVDDNFRYLSHKR